MNKGGGNPTRPPLKGGEKEKKREKERCHGRRAKGKGGRRREEGNKKGTRGCAYLIYIRQTWRMQKGRLESEGFFDFGNTGFRLSGATLVVGAGERFAGFNRNLEIELNLRLGA